MSAERAEREDYRFIMGQLAAADAGMARARVLQAKIAKEHARGRRALWTGAVLVVIGAVGNMLALAEVRDERAALEDERAAGGIRIEPLPAAHSGPNLGRELPCGHVYRGQRLRIGGRPYYVCAAGHPWPAGITPQITAIDTSAAARAHARAQAGGPPPPALGPQPAAER